MWARQPTAREALGLSGSVECESAELDVLAVAWSDNYSSTQSEKLYLRSTITGDAIEDDRRSLGRISYLVRGAHSNLYLAWVGRHTEESRSAGSGAVQTIQARSEHALDSQHGLCQAASG